VRVARYCESTVGEGEDQAAMTQAMSIEHVRPHRHAKTRESGSDILNPDTEISRCRVVGEERLRRKLSEPLRLRIRLEGFHAFTGRRKPPS
jgi:hypothetical protein